MKMKVATVEIGKEMGMDIRKVILSTIFISDLQSAILTIAEIGDVFITFLSLIWIYRTRLRCPALR